MKWMHKKPTMELVRKVGILAGTFDPVHAGHIAFALQAAQAAKLDVVYFLPERRPRNKPLPEHFAHRLAMLKAALEPYPNLQVLELPDVAFSTEHTLPRLQALYPIADMYMLVGSDVALELRHWSRYQRLLAHCGLIVGLRGSDTSQHVFDEAATWNHQPRELMIVDSFAPHVSSSHIRQSLRRNAYVQGLLTSVRRYANRQWLYVSFIRRQPDEVRKV
jgi:nicotinate-nucleotide adenylyltransferase